MLARRGEVGHVAGADMTARIIPTTIQEIGGEIAIAWDDGEESYLPLEVLRRACPCAGCCGEPDALGNITSPEVHYSPASFELRGWQLIGGYALQPTWGDGHGTGLFTFPYLRRLGAPTA